MSAAGTRAGGGFILLTLQDRIRLGLNRAARNFRNFAANLEQIGARITAISLAPTIGIGRSVQTFAQFEDSLLTLQAVAQKVSGFSFDTLGETIRELGRSTSFTAREIADAAVALGRGGFNAQQINEGLQSVLDLARATGTELPMAADIATRTITAFGLSTEETTRAMDVLVHTANSSAQTLEDLFEALKLAAPLAVQTGRSLEETSAALAVLANAGVRGTIAATALNRATANFSTLEGQEALRGLGVQAVDLAGNLRPLPNILAEMFDSFKNVGSAEQVTKLIDILGLRGILASQLGGRVKEFKRFSAELQNIEGKARSVAAAIDSGTGGALRRFKSAVESLAIEIGIALAGPLGMLVEWTREMVSNIARFVAVSGGLVAKVAAWTAGTLAFGAALTALGVVFNVLATSTGIVVGILTTMVGLMSGAVSLVFSLVGAIGTLASAIGAAFTAVVAFSGSLVGGIALFGTLAVLGVAAFVDILNAVSELTRRIGGALKNAVNGIGAAFGRVAEVVRGQIETIKELFSLGDIEAGVQVITETIKAAFKQAMAEALIAIEKVKLAFVALRKGTNFDDVEKQLAEKRREMASIPIGTGAGRFIQDLRSAKRIHDLFQEITELEKKLQPKLDAKAKIQALRDGAEEAAQEVKDKIEAIKTEAMFDAAIEKLKEAPAAISSKLEAVLKQAGVELAKPVQTAVADLVAKNRQLIAQAAVDVGIGGGIVPGIQGALVNFIPELKNAIKDSTKVLVDPRIAERLEKAAKIIADRKEAQALDKVVKELEAKEKLSQLMSLEHLGETAAQAIRFLGAFALAGRDQQQRLRDSLKSFSESGFGGDPRRFGGPATDVIKQEVVKQTDLLAAIHKAAEGTKAAVERLKGLIFTK